MQVKLLDESRRAIELFIRLHSVDENGPANDADLPSGEDVEDCDKWERSAHC